MRLLIWSEATAFGGHERMAAALADGLGQIHGVEVHWRIHPGNLRLREALGTTAQVGTIPSPRLPDRLIRGIVGELARAYHQALADVRPDLVLAIPGWPTCGSTPTLTASPIPVAVYVPNGPRGHGALDWLKRLASGHVLDRAVLVLTCAEPVAVVLRRCTRTPVTVVENFVDPPGPLLEWRGGRTEAVIGLIGRIDLPVKGHDLLITALADDPVLAASATWAVFGTGPDEVTLREMIRRHGLQQRVILRGWVHSGDAYQEVDAVIMPSRLEGAPLVAIEACLRRLPVIGSSLAELTPYTLPDFRFTGDSPTALGNAVRSWLARRDDPRLGDELTALADLVQRRHDRIRALSTMHQALASLIRPPTPICASPG